MTRIFDHPDFDQHEQVIFCTNDKVGLRAIIALHSTALRPAAGGCRMYPYESEADALADALRLSKSMTYKTRLRVCRLGVVNVQSLAGRYWTAIDVCGPR